ncbi:Hypothetical protein A7982_01824 [Minicystis rosea]|nr:Hypothetical protein A7982_01824 [Minicystis rosea]
MTESTMLLGAALNGIVAALLNRDTLLADFPRREELSRVKDQEFHPLSLYLEFCDYIENRLGVYAFLRVGRRMGVTVMATAFPPGIQTVEEAIAQVDGAHQMFCRPVVGAFDLTQRTPGQLVLNYTAPYNCTLQEGLFYEVALRYGAANATVTHAACRRKGAEACRFEIKY